MKYRVKLLMVGVLMSIGALSLADQPAIRNDAALALSILKNLEVNTFRNSFRPGGYPPGTTVDQTPYHVYEQAEDSPDTYNAVDAQRSWVYSVRVMKQDSTGITICFIDDSMQGSYLTAAALRVRKNRLGHYVVVKTLPSTSACRITRG